MKVADILFLGLALLLAGCGGSQDIDKTDFEGRLKAAISVQETGKRDEALSNVATDAAVAGNGAACLEAVSNISSSARRDDLAEDCAIRLAKAGKSTAASDVASEIRDSGRRSDANKAIATTK